MDVDAVDDSIASVVAQTTVETEVISVDDSSDGCTPMSEALHAGRQRKVRSDKRAKKDAEKEAAQKKAESEASMIAEVSGRTSLQVKALVHRMLADPLPPTPGCELGKYAIPHIHKPNEKAPAESDSKDDEIIEAYEELVETLSDPCGWQLSCGNQTVRNMSTDQCGKLGTTLAFWQPGQRCPFMCCRVKKWNSGGVCMYLTKPRFYRYLCESHLPQMMEWYCPVIVCNRILDRQIEVIERAVVPPHKLS